jgi:aconitate hydratase
MDHPNSFGARGALDVNGKSYQIYRLDALKAQGLDVARLPYGKPAAQRRRRCHRR